ncbi:MAG: hypothetical protein II103_06855, partial [Treponema sp.]|nr:hypothetical protein [Treponema sp.]
KTRSLSQSKRCFFCNHAPSTGTVSGVFLLRQNSFAELVEAMFFLQPRPFDKLSERHFFCYAKARSLSLSKGTYLKK